MSTAKKVFLVGPGFIGTEVLDLLREEQYSVTALTRRKEHATQLEKDYGIRTVMGQLDDGTLITEQTLVHDIVIHSATADHLPSVEAILNGLEQRNKQGKTTIYIHTSGTSVLDDQANGKFKSNKVFHDDIRSECDSVPNNAPHREIDRAIVRAQKTMGSSAKIAIMTPPLIYGYTKHKRLTIQIPTLTRFALKHGYAPYVGEGLSVESNIHVSDLARGYMTLLHHLEASAGRDTLANPYYYCETTGASEPSWLEIATLIASALHKIGKISNPEPKSLDPKLYGELFGPFTGAVVGLNSRSRAIRLRELGWSPKEKSWRESFLSDELPVILREKVGDSSGYKGTVAS